MQRICNYRNTLVLLWLNMFYRWAVLLLLCVLVGVPTFVLKFTPAPKHESNNGTIQEWWPVTRGLSVVDLLLFLFSTIIQVRFECIIININQCNKSCMCTQRVRSVPSFIMYRTKANSCYHAVVRSIHPIVVYTHIKSLSWVGEFGLVRNLSRMLDSNTNSRIVNNVTPFFFGV